RLTLGEADITLLETADRWITAARLLDPPKSSREVMTPLRTRRDRTVTLRRSVGAGAAGVARADEVPEGASRGGSGTGGVVDDGGRRVEAGGRREGRRRSRRQGA